jgi:hypothetical protein
MLNTLYKMRSKTYGNVLSMEAREQQTFMWRICGKMKLVIEAMWYMTVAFLSVGFSSPLPVFI